MLNDGEAEASEARDEVEERSSGDGERDGNNRIRGEGEGRSYSTPDAPYKQVNAALSVAAQKLYDAMIHVYEWGKAPSFHRALQSVKTPSAEDLDEEMR